MLILLWSLFAIAVSITFIYLCFKAIGLIKHELGLGAAIVFTIGLFSTCSRTNQNATNHQRNPASNVNAIADSLMERKQIQKLTLQKNLTFNINLTYSYAIHKNTKEVIPLQVFCHANGVTGAVEWVPGEIILEPDISGKKLVYIVPGDFKWKLFNLTLVTQSEIFEGVIEVE